jgi:hypothetical protein
MVDGIPSLPFFLFTLCAHPPEVTVTTGVDCGGLAHNVREEEGKDSRQSQDMHAPPLSSLRFILYECGGA